MGLDKNIGDRNIFNFAELQNRSHPRQIRSNGQCSLSYMAIKTRQGQTNSLSALGKRTQPPPISWLMREALKTPNLISLAAGFTDNTKLPVAATRQLTDRILRQPSIGRSALQYGTAAGNDAFLEQTSAHLAKLDHAPHRSGRVPTENMVITNGSQQFLYLLSEILCDPGDFVIVEDPTYFVYLSIMQSHGIRARTVPIESDGISLDRLEQTLESMAKTGDIKRLKFLYSVTYFQNPTGID